MTQFLVFQKPGTYTQPIPWKRSDLPFLWKRGDLPMWTRNQKFYSYAGWIPWHRSDWNQIPYIAIELNPTSLPAFQFDFGSIVFHGVAWGQWPPMMKVVSRRCHSHNPWDRLYLGFKLAALIGKKSLTRISWITVEWKMSLFHLVPI